MIRISIFLIESISVDEGPGHRVTGSSPGRIRRIRSDRIASQLRNWIIGSDDRDKKIQKGLADMIYRFIRLNNFSLGVSS